RRRNRIRGRVICAHGRYLRPALVAVIVDEAGGGSCSMAKGVLVALCGVIFAFTFANQALAETQGDPGGGYIEICKAANPALTGQFQFRIHDSFGDQSVTIGLGACTAPIAVDVPGPASSGVTVTELGGLTGLTNQGTLSPTADTSFLSASASAV